MTEDWNLVNKKRPAAEQLRVLAELDELAIRTIFRVADEQLQKEVMQIILTALRDPRKHRAMLRELHLLLKRPDVRKLIESRPR